MSQSVVVSAVVTVADHCRLTLTAQVAPGHYGFAFHTTSILANVILALSLSSLSKGWCLVRTRLTGAEQWSATVLAVALQLPTVYTLIFGDRALLAKLVLYTVFAEYLIGNGKLALERTALYIDRVQKVAFESGHAAEYVLVEKLSDIYRRKYAVIRYMGRAN